MQNTAGPGDGGSEATGVTGCDVAGRLRRPDTSTHIRPDDAGSAATGSIEKPQMIRQITICDNLIGNPIADKKIHENNVRNRKNSGDEGYIPLSHETELCRKYSVDKHIEMWQDKKPIKHPINPR